MINNKGYKNAPLLISLVDIKFTAIPNFSKELLIALESSLREFGFVEKIIEQCQQIEFEFKHDHESGEVVPTHKKQKTLNPVERCIFLNLERTTSIYFASDSLSIKTTDYNSHQEFSGLLDNVLETVIDHFPLITKSALSRIGTRYLNFIMPLPEHQVSRYVKSVWLPNNAIPEEIESKAGVHNFLTMQYRTNQGNLKIVSNLFSPNEESEGQIIPGDLADNPESALTIPLLPWWQEQIDKQISYVVLDIDLSQEKRVMFDKDEIISDLYSMRAITKPAFEMCITGDARIDWEEL